MRPALAKPRSWSQRRRWGMVALVFIVQLGFIFWLGSTGPIRPRTPASVLTFRFAGPADSELLALTDPTLFALPRQQNLAVAARSRTPRLEYHSSMWPAPTNQLLPALGHGSSVLYRWVGTNGSAALQLPVRPHPSPTIPDLPAQAVSAGQSVVLLEGDLAGRRLLAPLELKSWPNPEILASSVVEVVVDSEGRPVLARLLSGSGSPAADQHAVEQAKAARFEPVDRDPARADTVLTAPLNRGRMIFRWHTLPQSAGGNPSANP